MSATDPLLTERRDGVLVLTLNRPAVRNAVDRPLAEAMAAALDEALELAEAIAGNGPLGLVAAKKILQQQFSWSDDEFWDRQAEIADPVMQSQDAREGARAFAEKRPPQWQGR